MKFKLVSSFWGHPGQVARLFQQFNTDCHFGRISRPGLTATPPPTRAQPERAALHGPSPRFVAAARHDLGGALEPPLGRRWAERGEGFCPR